MGGVESKRDESVCFQGGRLESKLQSRSQVLRPNGTRRHSAENKLRNRNWNNQNGMLIGTMSQVEIYYLSGFFP
jgi:hypothetical protein